MRRRDILEQLAIDEWNNDPAGGAWTGYDAIEAQMADGEPYAEGAGVDPRDGYQRTAHRHLYQTARRYGYEPLRAERCGSSCLWYRFERRTA